MIWMMWASVALANDGLEWRWDPPSVVAYHVETVVTTPRGQRWYAEENDVARATKQMLLMDVHCTGQPAGKRTLVRCRMDNVEFRGTAIPGEEATLASIMARDARRLEGRTVSVDMRSDGRLGSVDVESDPAVATSRAARSMDGLRQMVERALAPLDLQLPKDGVDKAKSWKRKGLPLSMKLMTSQGTSGSVVLKHSVRGWNGNLARIDSTGRGTVAEGITMEQGTSTMLQVSGVGRAQFNTEIGVLDWSEVSGKVEYAAANLEGIGNEQRSSFSSWAARIDADGQRLEPTPD